MIFNVSPQRSGTKSFHALMQSAVIPASHYPGAELDDRAELAIDTLDTGRLWTMYADYYARSEAYSDFPTPLLYREALKAFPDAKFVLIHRNAHSWVRSVRTLTYDRDLSWLERFFYHSIIDPRRGYGLTSFSDGELANGYRLFCAETQNYLERNHANLFVGDLEDADLPIKLSRALGLSNIGQMQHLV